MDLGPTHTNFNLGTPRFEIPSLTTDSVILKIHTLSNKRSYLQNINN